MSGIEIYFSIHYGNYNCSPYSENHEHENKIQIDTTGMQTWKVG